MPDTNQETPPLWQFVNITDYRPPAASVKVVSENWFATLRKRLRPKDADSDSIYRINGLEALSHGQLARIAPDPDWSGAAAALDGALEDWLVDERPDRPTVFVVGPPHGGSAEILRLWAEHHRWRVLDPPAPARILTGDPHWLSSWMTEEHPWVLPALERIYLRHATGLDLLRQFLHQVHAGALGRGIVGCDSWAWAFLRRVAPPGCRSRKLTLQAFDKARLTLCFQTLAGVSASQPLLFRQANNGKYVLPPPVGTHDKPVVDSDFLQHLAAYSRGIPGIAWAIWRANLRAWPDDAESAVGKTLSDVLEATHPTIWLTPWDHLKKPVLPARAGRDQAFVLHALLLHNGLPAEWLARLLPLSPHQVMETLALLQDADLVERAGEVWRIAAPGYPAVREFLKDERFFIDDF